MATSRTFAGQSLRFNHHLYGFWKDVARFFLRFSRVRVSGTERLPRQGPCLLAPNHLNWKDVPFIGGVLERPVSFVATYRLFDMAYCCQMLREECDRWFQNPDVRRMIYRLNVFPARFLTSRVPRMGAIPSRLTSGEYSLIDSTLSAFHQGRLVCMFPEGRPGRPGRLHRFKPGLPRILLEYYKQTGTSIAVYPAGIRGTHWFYHPGMRLAIRIGEPLFIEDALQRTESRTLTVFSERLKASVWSLMTST